MKFKVSIDINLSADKVYELFMDKSKFKFWKKDFIGFEPLSGIPGEVGAVTKLIYKRQTMVERIVSRTVAREMVAEYEHRQNGKTNMLNSVTNRFIALSGNQTRLEVENEIIKVKGVIFKLLIRIMLGAGKKYAQTQLNQLKVFSEQKI
jgi:hypothetical protein